MDIERNIPKSSFKIPFIIAFALIITNCTNKSKEIDILEPIPANAIVLALIDNIRSLNFSLIEIQQLPKLESLQFLLRNIEDNLNGDFLISFHPIGAKDFHWLISIPRTSARSWHPSELSDEKNLKLIIKILGEEQEAGKIAKNIIKARAIKKIDTVTELVRIIEASKKRNYNKKINVCTKTFQALRIFVNKETTELIEGLIKASQFIKFGGKIITISFHSIEDKIIKYYFTNYSSNKSNPSRYMPTENNQKNSFFEKYKNNFITPSPEELIKNPASRSAKLREAIRTEQEFIYPKEFKEKFKKYLDIENVVL